jgi:hypothetical protein
MQCGSAPRGARNDGFFDVRENSVPIDCLECSVGVRCSAGSSPVVRVSYYAANEMFCGRGSW